MANYLWSVAELNLAEFTLNLSCFIILLLNYLICILQGKVLEICSVCHSLNGISLQDKLIFRGKHCSWWCTLHLSHFFLEGWGRQVDELELNKKINENALWNFQTIYGPISWYKKIPSPNFCAVRRRPLLRNLDRLFWWHW